MAGVMFSAGSPDDRRLRTPHHADPDGGMIIGVSTDSRRVTTSKAITADVYGHSDDDAQASRGREAAGVLDG
jgi:hypothetical protein